MTKANKLKAWLYPVAAVVAGAACALILKYAVKLETTYAVHYGVFAALCAYLIARLVVNIVYKTTTDSWKATMIWGAIGAGLFLWYILNTSYEVQKALIAGLGISIMCYLGFMFVDPKGEAAAAMVAEVTGTAESRKDKIKRLSTEMRYQLTENGNPNYDKPLCRVDGTDLTPAEADEKGYGAIAATGIEYIKTIV